MLHEIRFFLALLTTWAVEIPILFVLILLDPREKIPFITVIFAGILCTTLTLPYLWFVLPAFINSPFLPLIGEILVIIVEAAILNRMLGLTVSRSLAYSVIMNAVSYGLGYILL